MKPIYIMLAAWGESYIDATCVYLIGSLLTPGNALQLRAEDGHRFLVATTPQDWERFEKTPEFKALARHMTPERVELPAKNPGITVYRHMTDAHRRLVERAAEDRAFSCMLAPDVYLSEGFVDVLVEQAAAGTEVLLISAWHTAERKLFDGLASHGLLSADARGLQAIKPGVDALTLGRMVSDAVHPCVACMEWDSRSFDNSATFVWWRLPGEPGLLLHCMFWVEMGLDYAALDKHEVRELEHATIEALYVQDNFGENPNTTILDNGARAFLCSWKEDDLISEGAERRSFDEYVSSRKKIQLPLISTLLKGIRLRSAFYRATSKGRDRIKGRLIFRPVIWGRKELAGQDMDVERRAQRVLRTFIGDFDPDRSAFAVIATAPWFLLLSACAHTALFHRRLVDVYIPLIASYLKVVVAAAYGDKSARAQIYRRFLTVTHSLLGRT